MAKQVKLKEDVVKVLSDLVVNAMGEVNRPLDGSEKLIADIYTGRDPLGGIANIRLPDQGLPFNAPLEIGSWRPPETTANLFLSRLRQIVTNLTPGVPSIQVKARTSGAAHLAERQNELTRFLTDHGRLREAMRKAAFIGLLSPYFGIKLTFDKKEKIKYNRYKYETIEPRSCGYEPFHRRFLWQGYDIQWGDLPESWQPEYENKEDIPKDWEIVRVTEVYHEGFKFGAKKSALGECPMSVFVGKAKREQPDNQPINEIVSRDTVGEYVVTEALPACPIIIDSFLDAAPNEDVPAAEVLSWIPLMRMIVQTLVQITREISTVNKTVLYDKNAVREDAIEAVQNVAPGGTVFVGVDVDDTQRGVNATMRPVEQSSILNEYLAALQTYMRLFDDVTGVQPQVSPRPPRKSATEAASITESSNRRNQDRLEVMALMWSRLTQASFKFQREVLGRTVDVPLANGVTRTIPVPDPLSACFSFDVDPVEMGHMTARGDLNALMQWLNVTTTTQQAFAQGMPRMTREALRKLGKAMGIEDVDLFLDSPVIEMGPEERYIEYLQTQQPINVYEEDQHDMYIAYYAKALDKAAAQGANPLMLAELQETVMRHTMFAQRRASMTNQTPGGEVVPGLGRGPGEEDNNIAPQLEAGAVPQAIPQGAGGGGGY